MSRLLAAQRAWTVPGWVKDLLWRRAQAIPSLDLRFADDKSLTDAVTGASLVTFTRASSGTYVDSAGVLRTAAVGEPRFDHNPVTGESLGPLAEEARTNLLLRSQELDTTAVWGATNVTVSANTTTAPDGTQTADTITDINGVTANPFLLQTVTLVDSATYSMSCFLKAGTTTTARVGIRAKDATLYLANVDLVAGTITNMTATSASIQPHQNGWYRCVVTAPSNTGATSARGLIFINTISYTGTGAGSIHAWGAQLEAAAFATSYIPTTAAAATRSADVADLISSAIANNIRSLYVEFISPAVGTRGAASLNDNTANERIEIITSGTDPRLVVHDGGVEQANINGGTVTAGVKTRIAVRINANDFAISINGGTAVTDTSGTLPTVDRLMIGQTQAGEYLNGRIARFTGWTELLSNVTLQSLSQS